MNRESLMDKSRLAAFADGELTPEEAAEVVMHLADHPEDQAWVDDVMAANIALARAFSDPATQPVPDRFRALILPEAAAATVVPFRPRSVRRAGLAAAGLALAAAVALVAILPGGGAVTLRPGPVAADSALHAALTGQPSGRALDLGPGAVLTILASLPATDGPCREFELARAAGQTVELGLACRDAGGWTVDVVLAQTALVTAAGGQSGYQPASGADLAILEGWLDRRGAGIALSAEEEATAIQRGWQP